jgi:hypothetical protein
MRILTFCLSEIGEEAYKSKNIHLLVNDGETDDQRN